MLELVLGEEYGPEEDPVALGVRKQTQQLKTGGERKAVTGARATQGHRFQIGLHRWMCCVMECGERKNRKVE